jgi:hypothetical protein
MCLFQFNLLSKITPWNLTASSCLISESWSFILSSKFLWDLVNWIAIDFFFRDFEAVFVAPGLDGVQIGLDDFRGNFNISSGFEDGCVVSEERDLGIGYT